MANRSDACQNRSPPFVKSYRDGLTILGVSPRPARRWPIIVDTLRRLIAEGKLTAEPAK